jgi:hypothetical protein
LAVYLAVVWQLSQRWQHLDDVHPGDQLVVPVGGNFGRVGQDRTLLSCRLACATSTDSDAQHRARLARSLRDLAETAPYPPYLGHLEAGLGR